MDLFRFMSSGLEKLVSYSSDADKCITHKYYPNVNHFELVTRKGVFSYEYVFSWNKLNDVQLPSQEDFYSKLNNAEISQDDYHHSINVWHTFNVKTLGEYSDLYLKTDVSLLADDFENFRRNYISAYVLDPLHYYTALGLAVDAMLKYTGVKLELFTDSEKLLFVEKGIRGGVAQFSNRYALANNRYMDTNFDSRKDETYLMYCDVENLYGAAMSEYLVYGPFEWDYPLTIDIYTIPIDASVGYILGVDRNYP